MTVLMISVYKDSAFSVKNYVRGVIDYPMTTLRFNNSTSWRSIRERVSYLTSELRMTSCPGFSIEAGATVSYFIGKTPVAMVAGRSFAPN